MKEIRKTFLDQDQRELRLTFLGGFAGQLVSGVIWIIASVASVLFKPEVGMVVLFFGCMMIFPLTTAILRFMGKKVDICKDNGLWPLGTQVAFTVPINFLLVGIITLYNPMLFFPSVMIIVGAHYLPFITLYGMKMFGILSVILISGGSILLFYNTNIFSIGGWFTGFVLVLFAFIGKYLAELEEKRSNHEL